MTTFKHSGYWLAAGIFFLLCMLIVDKGIAQDMPEGTYLKVNPNDLYAVDGEPDPPTCEDDPYMDGCPCVPPEIGTGYPNCDVPPPIDPCDLNPEEDGCPCPDSTNTYPNCEDEEHLYPLAVDDYFTEDEWRTTSVLDNDINRGGPGPMTARLMGAEQPDSGTVGLSSAGMLTFVPDDPDFEGLVATKYKAYDGELTGNRAVIRFCYVTCELPEPPPELPTDPNEPVEPPVEPPVEEPWPPVTYVPDLPPVGEYSVEGACYSAFDDVENNVTLQPGEALDTALARLRAKNSTEGIIYVPWDLKTVQCDILGVGKSLFMEKVALIGQKGPNGERPRFYCRDPRREGTVAPGSKRMAYFGRQPDKSDPPSWSQYMVQSIHIDGYSASVMVPKNGRLVLRDNYMHHAYGDGIKAESLKGELETCGNEISHSGLGNYKHGLYLAGTGDSLFVDNDIHSCGGSSCYKSTTNINQIINNEFANWKETDPSYADRYSQMLIDTVACAEYTLIEGNELNTNVHEGSSQSYPIGIRNRKRMYGCDKPPGWTGNSITDTVKLDDSEFWDNSYWLGLDGQFIFPYIIKDNTIGIYGARIANREAIMSWGTYPNVRSSAFGPACMLVPPIPWYERSKVYVSGNTYWNYYDPSAYGAGGPGHSEEKCGYPEPESWISYDYYDIGEGETFMQGEP